MGFLDDLFGKSSGERTPDTPISFGYNTVWLCVRANSPEDVIKKLGLKNSRESNWQDGFKEVAGVSERVFVSPILDGYVLVINWGADIITENPARLDEVGAAFPEVNYFATQNVTDYYAWVKYADGDRVRGYCRCGESGEVILNDGEPTSEEAELGFTNFIPDNEVDWDDYEMPDEETVIQIAAAWGIDPKTVDRYPASTGFVCD